MKKVREMKGTDESGNAEYYEETEKRCPGEREVNFLTRCFM